MASLQESNLWNVHEVCVVGGDVGGREIEEPSLAGKGVERERR